MTDYESKSGFHLVEKLRFPPAKCLVTGDIDGPFIDFGAWAAHIFQPVEGVDPHVAISAPVIKEAAKILGMVPREEVEKFKADLAAHKAKVEELTELVEALTQRTEAEEKLKELVA